MHLASSSEKDLQLPGSDASGAQKSVQRFTDHREAVNYMMEQVKHGSPVYVYGGADGLRVQLTRQSDHDAFSDQSASVSQGYVDNRMLDFVC